MVRDSFQFCYVQAQFSGVLGVFFPKRPYFIEKIRGQIRSFAAKHWLIFLDCAADYSFPNTLQFTWSSS